MNGPAVEDDLWITDNLFDNVGTASGVPYDHSTIYVDALSGVHITGNQFNGAVTGGGAFGATTAIKTHGGGVTVLGNNVTDYEICGNIVTNSSSNSTSGDGGIVVSGNVCKNVAYGFGIWNPRS